MNQKILIAYASGLGSTAEVAVKIGQTLNKKGFAIDVKPIEENPQVSDYQAVILGSAVRHGNWLPKAVEFIKANQKNLNQVPVALFTVHITNLGNDSSSQQNRLSFLDLVRPLLNPFDEVFFAGKFDRRGAALMLPSWLARLVPTLDLRKWEKIQAWTECVHPKLLQQINREDTFINDPKF